MSAKPLPLPSTPNAGCLPLWAPEPPLLSPPPADVLEAGLRHHHLANTAYPLAHRKTIWCHRQPADRHAALLREALATTEQLSLYAHIPFCERRCAFCEYTVVDAHDELKEQAYHKALLAELALHRRRLDLTAHTLVGLDIGGGTPSLVDPRRIIELVDTVTGGFRLAAGFGISIETTPRIAALQPDRLRSYFDCGIERISMGLQTASPRLLRRYGRERNLVDHNAAAVHNIRRAGFRQLNIDLMYGFAGQTQDDFAQTIEHAVGLQPDVITLYRVRYKGTRVASEASRVRLDQVMGQYELARRLLAEAGYLANPGKNTFSRQLEDPGTSAYLTARVVRSIPYLGLGLGAQSFTNNLLAYNLGAASKRLPAYLRAVAAGRLPIQDLYHLPPSEGMAKMVSVSFYFGAIHADAFFSCFGISLQQAFPAELDFVLRRGLMEWVGPELRLTREGARRINGVIALFYSPAVKAHLLELPATAQDVLEP